MLVPYESKKAMSLCIGKPLRYTETSMFGDEYKADGTFFAAHRPAISRGDGGREFFAQVTMANGLITKVE
jgi:hypothetical protein